jgi:hypothetical protein
LPINWLTVELLSSGQLNGGATGVEPGVEPGEVGFVGSATVAALLEAGMAETVPATLVAEETVTVVAVVLWPSMTVVTTLALANADLVTTWKELLDVVGGAHYL